jgi:hypothetical protein
MTLKGPASEKQMQYLHALLRLREVDEKWHLVAEKRIEAGLTKDEASKMIDWFSTQPTKAMVTQVPRIDVKVGVYTLVDGTVCKVQKSRASGSLYALKMGTGYDGKPTFTYTGGLIHVVRAEGVPMSLEDACKIGVQTGVCVICNTPLTDPVSIAKGIGPVCEKKQGALAAAPYGTVTP